MSTNTEVYQYSGTGRIRTFLKVLAIMLFVVIIALLYLLWFLSKPRGEFAETKANFRLLFSIYAFGPNDNLRLPHTVTTDKDGNFYVGDTGNARILVFNSKGMPLRKLGEGKIATPTGLSIAEDNGDIYVADRMANAVHVFSQTGKLKKTIYMHLPLDVKVVKDKVYITTFGPLFITKRDGKVIQKIGNRGRGLGNFDFPNGVAVGSKGEIYISDLNNLRIQALDKNGELMWFVGEPPKSLMAEDRRFGLPAGIAIDEKERLLLVDAFHHSLRILTNKGKELVEFGEMGHKEGELYLPAGIAYMGNGRVAIADKYNNRINVYRLINLDRLD